MKPGLSRPFFARYRLNPERPMVWFVGRDEDGNLDKIELELLPEGLPYMVPSWWSETWGPFSREDAIAIVAGRKSPGSRSPIRSGQERARDSGEYVSEERPDIPIRHSGRLSDINWSNRRLGGDGRSSSRGVPLRRGGMTRNIYGEHVHRELGPEGMRCPRNIKHVHSWYECVLIFENTRRARDCVKIGSQTWLIKEIDRGAIIFNVQYHSTNIVRYFANSIVKLHVGEWPTVTTKQRINEHLPRGFVVYSVRTHNRQHLREGVSTTTRRGAARSSVWMLYDQNRHSSPHLFQDGMIINTDTGEIG